MVNDKAVCPECESGFAVTRYGRRIPCPRCGTLLDIMPDESQHDGKVSTADWRCAVEGKLAYLLDAAEELKLMAGTESILGRIAEEVERIHIFLSRRA